MVSYSFHYWLSSGAFIIVAVIFYKVYSRGLAASLHAWIYEKMVVAHRGLYLNPVIPENSLRAFKEALNQNFPIEFDVMLSKDLQPVVIHDDNLLRLCGIDQSVSNFTLAELKKLRILQSEETIPTLEEVLNLIHGKVPLYLEIKQNKKIGILEEKILNALKKYRGKTIILSFNPWTLAWFAKHAPEYPRAQNFSWRIKTKEKKLAALRRLIQYCWLSQPHMINYAAGEFGILLVRLLSCIKPSGIFTVRDKLVYQKFRKSSKTIIFENLSTLEK